MGLPLSLDVLLSDEVCRLLDSFASVMKIQVVFYSRSGRILKRGRDFGNSRFCRLMQQKYFGLEKCRRLDDEMQAKVLHSGDSCCYCCHAGLNEMIFPVKIFGEIAGFVVFGQFRTVSALPSGVPANRESVSAFEELPFFAPEDIGHLQDMGNMLIGYIVGRELISYSGSFRYHQLLDYIERHCQERISLKSAARFLNVSESTLTHFLKEKYGTSFKSLLISKRLEKAETVLKNSPSISIAETALLCGFEDPHYFSRLYRQKRGVPISVFRKSLY